MQLASTRKPMRLTARAGKRGQSGQKERARTGCRTRDSADGGKAHARRRPRQREDSRSIELPLNELKPGDYLVAASINQRDRQSKAFARRVVSARAAGSDLFQDSMRSTAAECRAVL